MRSTRFVLTAVAAAVAWLGLVGPAHADLIHHWKFDEAGGATAADSGNSSNLLPLTLQGNAAFDNDLTRGGQVLELDGSGDYANNTSGVPFTADINHTVGVWVNHADPGDLTQRWIGWGATSGGRYFIGPYAGQHIDDNGNIWWGLGTGNAKFTESDAHPEHNTWQYWTLVREGTAARLYLDGNLVETLTVAAQSNISTPGELRVGRQYSGDEYLNGRMDDLAIWNVALEEWQIQNAMEFGAENYLIPEPSSALLLSFAVMGALITLGSRRRRPDSPMGRS